MLKNVLTTAWSRFRSRILFKVSKFKIGRNFEPDFFIGPDLKKVTLVKALKPWIHCALCNVYYLCLNVETKVGFMLCYIY